MRDEIGFLTPVIPQYITVHLGAPDAAAPNIRVPFADYIKNVASNEIYPTWPEDAIVSNILAQISFALNRVYTEYYRSRGYDFDITSSTAYDQSYQPEGAVFENISTLVEDVFTNYIRRMGFVEPLFAAYCDGIRTQCEGLSQWGTVDRAKEGLGFFEILQYYYGEDIELVNNAPVGELMPSAPVVPLRYGSSGNDVRLLQVRLNRIATNYPSIPKIPLVDGIFDNRTEEAVLEFQRIFGLTQDGIVGNATWYKVEAVYAAVKRLNELISEGIDYEDVIIYPITLSVGDEGIEVEIMQYYLNFIAQYTAGLEPVESSGIYGNDTAELVAQFQLRFGLEPTGVIDNATFEAIYDEYVGILASLPENVGECQTALYPGYPIREGFEGEAVALLQTYLNGIVSVFPEEGELVVDGIFGPRTKQAVLQFEEFVGLPADGIVDALVWMRLTELFTEICEGQNRAEGQYPGYELREREESV